MFNTIWDSARRPNSDPAPGTMEAGHLYSYNLQPLTPGDFSQADIHDRLVELGLFVDTPPEVDVLEACALAGRGLSGGERHPFEGCVFPRACP